MDKKHPKIVQKQFKNINKKNSSKIVLKKKQFKQVKQLKQFKKKAELIHL